MNAPDRSPVVASGDRRDQASGRTHRAVSPLVPDSDAQGTATTDCVTHMHRITRVEHSLDAVIGLSCCRCGHAIADAYFVAGDANLCPACRSDVLTDRVLGGGRHGLVRGAVASLAGASVGAVFWWGARTVGHAAFAGALVTGWLVGGWARRAARDVGSTRLQVFAVVAVYAAAVAAWAGDAVRVAVARGLPASVVALSHPLSSWGPQGTWRVLGTLAALGIAWRRAFRPGPVIQGPFRLGVG